MSKTNLWPYYVNPNGTALYDSGIIVYPDMDSMPEDAEKYIQQHGCDLTIEKVFSVGKITAREPMIGIKNQSKDPVLQVIATDIPGREGRWFHLNPGVYEVESGQGCNIPNNLQGHIRQRSTLLRNGVILHSSVFDAGFKTDKIGTVFVVHHPNGIIIEKGARFAQIYFHVCMPVAEKDLYGSEEKGSQYQGK